MKKALKIGLISVASLLMVIAITVSILLFSVFSPSKLAKMVNSQADRFITCDFHIDEVGLTFFKTFPKIGLDLKNVVLKNPQKAGISDTLLYVKDCVAAFNIQELVNNHHAEINDFSLCDGLVNLYIDENGNGNYKVFRSNPDDTSSFNYTIDLQKVNFQDLDIRYQNTQSRQAATLHKANASITGTFDKDNIEGQLEMNAESARFVMANTSPVLFAGKDIKASYGGQFTNFNLIDGIMKAEIGDAMVKIDTTRYINHLPLSFTSDLEADLAGKQFSLESTSIALDNQELKIEGTIGIDTINDDIHTHLHYQTGNWRIDEVLPLIPKAILGNKLDNIDIDGNIALEGDVKGIYNKQQKPIITSGVAWHNGRFAIKDFPLDFDNVDGHFDFDLDLNNLSDLTVKSLSATTRKRNRITASGTVKNLFGKMLCDVLATGDVHIKDFHDFLPKDFTHYDGKADLHVKTQLEYDPQAGFSIDNISKAFIDGRFSDLELLYHDTMNLYSPDLQIDISFPVTEKPYKIGEWLNAKVKTSELYVQNKQSLAPQEILGSSLLLDAYTNNLLDSTVQLKFATTYHLNQLNVQMDTIAAQLFEPQGVLVMKDKKQLLLDYKGDNVRVYIGEKESKGSLTTKDLYTLTTENITLHAETDFKDSEDNVVLRWSPTFKLQLTNAKARVQNVAHSFEFPVLNVDFNPQKCVLKKANLKYGESDVNLSGTITGIEPYIHNKGLLKGNLELVANFLNLNELMELVNGFGAPDSLVEQAEELTANNGKSPFIVPFGVDVNVNTTIKKALYEEADFHNIAGRVYIKDGVLVLEEVGLTNEAARMQLTAMYRTPRMNHLFLGFDFHLLDIKIDKLIAMIPEVDTILPMLKAFSGNAEFHFAAETYMRSNYDIKLSTLRGAAAINGQNLVVLDNETYKTIAKKLMFNKKTKNIIDSLSTEITIFRNEVDVYPFLLSIDKYSAIISGRHNLDMTYNYNISLLKPIRIGLDIIGLEDRLKYKVGKAKYPTLFKPEKRNVVESNILELKTLINKTLQENVR